MVLHSSQPRRSPVITTTHREGIMSNHRDRWSLFSPHPRGRSFGCDQPRIRSTSRPSPRSSHGCSTSSRPQTTHRRSNGCSSPTARPKAPSTTRSASIATSAKPSTHGVANSSPTRSTSRRRPTRWTDSRPPNQTPTPTLKRSNATARHAIEPSSSSAVPTAARTGRRRSRRTRRFSRRTRDHRLRRSSRRLRTRPFPWPSRCSSPRMLTGDITPATVAAGSQRGAIRCHSVSSMTG